MKCKSEIKKTITEHLKSRNIILFGASIYSEEFYEKYKDCMSILYCVSNVRSEWGTVMPACGLEIKQFCPDNIPDNSYIVVCGERVMNQVERQLMSCGYKVFDDYVDSDTARAAYSGKPIVLFGGNCIERDVYECVITIPEFVQKYEVFYGAENGYDSKYDRRSIYYVRMICDYYICPQTLLASDTAYLFLDNELPEDCVKISLSNIDFTAYWPQINPDTTYINDYFIYSYNTRRDLTFSHLVYKYEDCNINKLIAEKKTTAEICNIVSDLNFYDEKAVLRNEKFALRTIKIAETNADIKVMDFILDNYRDYRVFQNPTHLHKSVEWEYVRQIMQRLGIDKEYCDRAEKKAPEYTHHGGDIPIYPSVADKMGLDWINEDYQYEIMTYNGIQLMTFKEYVYHYIEYCEHARDIMEMW